MYNLIIIKNKKTGCIDKFLFYNFITDKSPWPEGAIDIAEGNRRVCIIYNRVPYNIFYFYMSEEEKIKKFYEEAKATLI